MNWSTILREVDDILDAWEAYVADPVNEVMPVTAVPVFPDRPIEPELVDIARRAKARSDTLQVQLGQLLDTTAGGLAELRRQRSAAATYRTAVPGATASPLADR